MQTKSGIMDDCDENREYRDYDDVGQTENKRRWGQIFVIETQVVDANSDIDQDSLLSKHLNFSSCLKSRFPPQLPCTTSPLVSHHIGFTI